MYKRLLDLNDFILELCYHKIAYKLILEGVKIELTNRNIDLGESSVYELNNNIYEKKLTSNISKDNNIKTN